MDKNLNYQLEIANTVFTIWFLVEFLLKLIGSGLKNYLRDSFNIFDAIIVIFSVIELILTKFDILSID